MAAYATDAVVYRKKPALHGGGNGSFIGFRPGGGRAIHTETGSPTMFRIETEEVNYYVLPLADNVMYIVASSKLIGDGDLSFDERNACLVAKYNADGQIDGAGYILKGQW